MRRLCEAATARADSALEALRHCIGGMDDQDEHKWQSRIALVLILATGIGTDIARLAEYIGYPEDFIKGISRPMHAAGLWRHGEATRDGWWSDQDELTPIFWGNDLVAMDRFLERSSGLSSCERSTPAWMINRS